MISVAEALVIHDLLIELFGGSKGIRDRSIDHNPPHFHAEYGEFKAEYSIKSLEIIDGKLPGRANALVLEWASIYREELMANWERAQQAKSLKKIRPLD